MKSALAILIALLAMPVVKGATNAASEPDLSAFRIISQRNIFDPNRSPGRQARRTEREPQRTSRTERFALLGTMSYEKGRFAFFDGSSSEYRKSLKPGDGIAGFKIAEVAPTCVKLETTNSEVLELCVGMQMQRRDTDAWQLVGKAELPDIAKSSSTGRTELASSGGSDDVARRLMQQREQDGGAQQQAEPLATNVIAQPAETNSTRDASSDDEVVRRLLERREQEINK
jgi:hypothetical protein